jgi:hypothetical protein
MIGVLTTRHCHNGLLPLPVAPSQDARTALVKTSSFPLCPGHRPGPTLMSAWILSLESEHRKNRWATTEA